MVETKVHGVLCRCATCREERRQKSEGPCIVDGCEHGRSNKSYRLKEGLCPAHYQRRRMCGDVRAATPVTRKGPRKPWTRALRKRAYRYGLTVERLQELLAHGRCDICGTTEPGGSGDWHVDHDHACCDWKPSATGQKCCGKCVRGILCMHCNAALGHVKDNSDRLRALIAYLERHVS